MRTPHTYNLTRYRIRVIIDDYFLVALALELR